MSKYGVGRTKLKKRKLITNRILSRNRSEHKGLSRTGTDSKSAKRRFPEELPDKINLRRAFARDSDRIIHTDAYARYFDKTQVFFRVKNDHITRRSLHVQFVAKLARTLARFFEVNEDLAEAIALGHDLGHAPFGHAGEEVLAEILEKHGEGTFVHNAQSVRILEILEKNNISLQVLDGILGHNGEIKEPKILYVPRNLSWEKFDNSVESLLSGDLEINNVYPSTIEGSIVRIADVISYIGRDLFDAQRLGIIKGEDLPNEILNVLGNDNSKIINTLMLDLTYTSFGRDYLSFSNPIYEAYNKLRDFNFERIYKAQVVQDKIGEFKTKFRKLFEYYINEIDSGHPLQDEYAKYLNRFGESYTSTNTSARIVADFMAGMTDGFLLKEYNEKNEMK